ncbi:unnamed protein product [Prunus armeniaca]
MSSPKTRAQSSSAPVPPDYIIGTRIDKHAIEVMSKLHPFAQKNLDENVLHLFKNTLVLGPYWFGLLPAEMAELLKNDVEAPLEVRNSPVKWADWIDRLLPRYGGHWKRTGIYDAILLSKQSINRDENLLAAALCFWNSARNTFDFRVGPMTPTLLDTAQIFGFRPHGRPVDAIGDYHKRKNKEKMANPFTISPAMINQNYSFSNYLRNFSAEKDKDQQHMLFLLYWLNSFGSLLQESAQCHLGESIESVGPWCILDDPDLAAEVPKCSIEEYLMFFRHCTKRSAAQWQELEEDSAITDFRKKFLSVTSPRDLPHGGGKPPNDHLGAEVYHPNFCARQLGCPQLIPLKSYRSCNWASSWRDTDDLEARFQDLSAEADAKKSMIQTIKDINAQIIEDPSLIENIGGQSVHAGEVIVTYVIVAGDLELPSIDEKDETQAEQTPVEATPFARRKRKGIAPPPDNTAQPDISAESPPPPLTKSKGLRKRTEVEYVATEEPAGVPTTTSGTDEELGEAFEEVEQEKELEELEEEEIPAEVIADSIALAQKHHESTRAELTSSELALFEDAEAEHSTAIPTTEEQAEQSASEPVEQVELPIAVPEAEVETVVAIPVVVVGVPRSIGALAMVTSPLKPPIVAMPIHSLLGASTTASFVDPEMEEFEAMDLDA